jgi:DNA-binding CsgD family transcriptional regulator/tetratricopeptide (TPR) repeat protein
VRTALEIVGREQEVRVIDGFVREGTLGVLVLEGDPGIGKTTLWRHGVELAKREWLALVCSPTEAESALAFAAAGDLLGPHARRVVGTLPLPQRRALAAALLLDDARGAPAEPRAVAAGFLGALRELARDRPVLVAVDDIQWLDGPSALLLDFALRRVDDEPIAFLLARRLTDEARVPLGLDRASPESIRRLTIGPLSIGALHRLLRARIGASFPRPLLSRIHQTSGGNPLYALELARVLNVREVAPQAGVPLPVPATLTEVVRDRIASLPPKVSAALAAAAALAAPTVSAVGAEDELDIAARAGVVEIDGGRVRFTHPLLAAAAYAAMPPGQRRRLHARLAGVVADPEERARHRALSATQPSAEVGDELEDAAAHAAGRGAPATAAELLELAAHLTPRGHAHDARRRSFEGARRHFAAGNAARACGLLEELLLETPPGGERCDALLALAEIREENDLAAALALFEEAVREARRDAPRLALAYARMSQVEFTRGDSRSALRYAREALAQAEQAGDLYLLVDTIAWIAFCEALYGGETVGLLERGLALECELDEPPPLYSSPAFVRGLRLMHADRVDESRDALERQLARADERGDEAVRAICLFHLAELEWRAGRWAAALERAEQSLELVEQSGVEQGTSAALFARALISASIGRADEARADAERGIALADVVGDETFRIKNTTVLGFLELSLGNAAEAARLLSPLWDLLASRGFREPSDCPVLPNAIEALVATGKLDEAVRLQAQFEEAGREFKTPWALATAARCRGLIEAARGDLDAAVSQLEQALAEHERLLNPLERGRTLLALGTVRRRGKEKRAAREALDSSIAIFDELPARLWADRARAERARIGGRVAAGELTATERGIAKLVAQGHSNKDVAAQLFITPRTVEGHLTRIYEKLGVRSRSELAHRLPTPPE